MHELGYGCIYRERQEYKEERRRGRDLSHHLEHDGQKTDDYLPWRLGFLPSLQPKKDDGDEIAGRATTVIFW